MPGFSDEEITALATAFATGSGAKRLLIRSGFPAEHLPSQTTMTGYQFWSEISEAVASGILDEGRIRILTTALETYPYNPVFKKAMAEAPAGRSRPLRVLVMGAGLGATAATAATATGGPARAIRADQESRLLLKVQELGHLEVELLPAATIDDLVFDRARPPDVLHLICHGDRGALVFGNEFGDPRRVPATAIADLIRAYAVRLRGVVLNACSSGDCAEVFAPLADTVIAHKGAVDDDCARLFAEELYRAMRGSADLAEAAGIAATRLAVGSAQCPELRDGLVVLSRNEGR
ncbi:hypothetical protein ABH926_002094 [Catenulispora sp. GP43]|uniref:effector-associated domain EAD1-containing protein n=1 Tax=Catenulispora sp. GP43 TaxID=3156263 RepID=UPI003510E3C2